MKKITLLSLLFIAQMAQAKTIELPAQTMQYRPSDLPGYLLTVQQCSTCHSVEYTEYQPPTTGIGYWNAQVIRMKKVFNAPIADEDIPVIVDYLSKTYGANRK